MSAPPYDPAAVASRAPISLAWALFTNENDSCYHLESQPGILWSHGSINEDAYLEIT